MINTSICTKDIETVVELLIKLMIIQDLEKHFKKPEEEKKHLPTESYSDIFMPIKSAVDITVITPKRKRGRPKKQPIAVV